MPYIIDRRNVILVNVDNKSKPSPYPQHDLNSVFTHWDDTLKRNIPTPNELPVNNGNDKNKLK